MSTREHVVPLDTFLDEETFVVEVPFCSKYDVIPTPIVEAPHYVQVDIILHAISQFCSLEKHALVESYEERAPQDRIRKYYHLTEAGRLRLQEKQQEWTSFVTAMEKILKGGAAHAAQ